MFSCMNKFGLPTSVNQILDFIIMNYKEMLFQCEKIPVQHVYIFPVL